MTNKFMCFLLVLVFAKSPLLAGLTEEEDACDCAEPTDLIFSSTSHPPPRSVYWVGEEIPLEYVWNFGEEGCRPYSFPHWNGLGTCGRKGTEWWNPEKWWAIAQDGDSHILDVDLNVEYSTMEPLTLA